MALVTNEGVTKGFPVAEIEELIRSSKADTQVAIVDFTLLVGHNTLELHESLM